MPILVDRFQTTRRHLFPATFSSPSVAIQRPHLHWLPHRNHAPSRLWIIARCTRSGELACINVSYLCPVHHQSGCLVQHCRDVIQQCSVSHFPCILCLSVSFSVSSGSGCKRARVEVVKTKSLQLPWSLESHHEAIRPRENKKQGAATPQDY